MRKWLPILLVALFLIVLAVPASAAVHASTVDVKAVVGTDEKCYVTVDCTLYVDETLQSLRYPVPLEATDIFLNNSRVWGQRTASCQYIDLSKVYGMFHLSYTLPDVIHTGSDGNPELRLPLLSGFEYPISRLDFSVTIPGEVDFLPAFSSGYHQASIEKDLTYSVNGANFLGNSLTELKDHETLTMTLRVDQTLFPDAQTELFTSESDDTAMLICILLALAYWILFLRALPPRRRIAVTAPEGCGAGQVGAMLTLGKLDLTMMVFQWAQLGYILIQADRYGRVLLHKRMDMGNERTALEQKCFRSLFGARDLVDTGSLQYATLSRKISKLSPNFQSQVHPRSGNPRLFRALAATVGLFAGVSIGIAMTQGVPGQTVWVFMIVILTTILSLLIQGWASCLFVYDKTKLWVGLICAGIFLVLGGLAGEFSVGLTAVIVELLAGLMAFYGGRRTAEGRQDMAQILGLRRYLKKAAPDQLQRILENDPDHFHSLAPYALAFGREQAFARLFGKTKLSQCPYLTTGMDGHRTASEWAQLLRQTARMMNRRAKRMPAEKFGEFFAFFKH